MNLQEFVAATLEQVIVGVDQAKLSLMKRTDRSGESLPAHIAPKGIFRDAKGNLEYTPGDDSQLPLLVEFDVAVKMKPAIDEFLKQPMRERATWKETREGLLQLADEIRSLRERLAPSPSAGAEVRA